MMKNKEVISTIKIMESIIKNYLDGKLETEIANLLDVPNAEVLYVLHDKDTITNEMGIYQWKAIINKRNSNNRKLYYALSTLRQKPDLIRNDQLMHIINSFLLSHMSVSDYCSRHNIPETYLTFDQPNMQELQMSEITAWKHFMTTIEINKQIEQKVNEAFSGKNMDLNKELQRKEMLFQELQQKGCIRPYWICGMLAIHNFSYKETCEKAGITEPEASLANYFYMKTICSDINGNALPYDCSFQILQSVSFMNSNEPVQKSKTRD